MDTLGILFAITTRCVCGGGGRGGGDGGGGGGKVGVVGRGGEGIGQFCDFPFAFLYATHLQTEIFS